MLSLLVGRVIARRNLIPMLRLCFSHMVSLIYLEQWKNSFLICIAYILHHNPATLLRGDDYRALRRLYNEATSDPDKETEWQQAWMERLEGWQRNKIYEGLDKVFLGFCSQTRIKAPSWYKHTTIETWAETIKGIAILRNCVAHGVRITPKELSEFSTKPYAMFFDFQEGEPLKIELRHLQSIEAFTDQFLTAINYSLLELAGVKPPATT